MSDDLDKAINKFLYELTELCRQHGMYLEEDTYMAYGETYGYLKIENFGSEGTEAFYYIDNEGEVQFGSPDGGLCLQKLEIGINPPVDDVSAFSAVKKHINKLFEKQWEENRKAQQEAWTQYDQMIRADWDARLNKMEPRKPACRCGKTFKTEVSRDKHCETTGHGPDPFGK